MTAPETGSDVTTDVTADAQESPKLQLQVEVESPSACERHVTVTVSREDVDRYLGEAVGEMMPEAHVPGFRAGRAPRKLVETHFRRELKEKVKGSLLLDTMTQVNEQQEFSAISEPDFDFDAVELPDEGPFTFEFDLEVRPEFEMPKWKGLQLEKPTREFGREEIDNHLRRMLERQAVLEPHDGPAENGDFVVVDMQFSRPGAQAIRAHEQTIRIRPTVSFRDGNIEGFDKLMVGATADTEKATNFKVSEEAENEELRGQELDVKLKVLDVKRLRLPEIDEQFLKRVGGYDSEGDLRDAVKGELQRQLRYHQNRSTRDQITALLTEAADWELPPDLLRRQSQRELERATMELRSSGFSDEDIRAHANLLRQNSQRSTATALKEHFILERIAEDEELDATEEDYDGEIALMALQSHESPRSVRARLEKRGLMDSLRNQIIERKAIALIAEAASFKEVPFKLNEDQTSAVDFAVTQLAQAEIPDAKYGGDQRQLPQPADHT